jgi:hypothetical protein
MPTAVRRAPQLPLQVQPPRHCVYCCVHTHCSCTPAFLAQLFRIRQQRVMAILALKQLEAQAEAEYVKVGFIDNANQLTYCEIVLSRIRQQRVMAILALKQLEAQAEVQYVKVGFGGHHLPCCACIAGA